MHKKVILTGAPSTGKTSCLHQLKALGWEVSNEIARKVIEESTQNQSDIVPWKNLTKFSEVVFKLQTKAYKKYQKEEWCFFDRSPIDVIAYLNLGKLPVSPTYTNTIQQLHFHPKVFIFPFWEKIYSTDAVRKEDQDKAIQVENHLIKSYQNFGYQLISVPKTSISQRIEFILNELNLKT